MYLDVLNFWFKELKPQMWWKKNEDIDALIREKFLSLHQQAPKGELYTWRNTGQGSLAEIIILDQFSRNMFRDTPQAFENDMLALALAQFAIEKGFHINLSKVERIFLYLPFMHSESTLIHNVAVQLYSDLGEASNLEYEFKHKAIIDRFGRYPHRNEALGRQSTPEEIEFLKQPNSGF